ncbi:hypothetical protein ACX80Z_04045 [Arthrobacter sp. TMT4-20]
MPQELLIALIAAGAALAGTLLGSFLTRTTEHKQWIRNEKKEAYWRFIEVHSDMKLDDTLPSLSRVRLVGSGAVYSLASDVSNQVQDVHRRITKEDAKFEDLEHETQEGRKAVNALVHAMKRDLKL